MDNPLFGSQRDTATALSSMQILQTRTACSPVESPALCSPMNDDTAPATKRDIQAVLKKLDDVAARMATKDEMAVRFADVDRRLDLLNKNVDLIINNLNRIDAQLDDHDQRIEQLEQGQQALLRV